MSDQIFIDAVGEIRLLDGVIRMDLLTTSAQRRGANGESVPEFAKQLVMTPNSFLRMVTAIGGSLDQLKEKGLLTVADPASEPKAPASEDAVASSPNFS